MRDIKLLTPEAQRLLALFSHDMTMAGLNFIVTSTLRTIEEQKALYAQGREELSVVNALRKAVGWGPISAKENANEVTWTMNSRHMSGNAFDIALIFPDTKKPHWNEKVSVNANQMKDYEEAATIGRSAGLIAGYFWEKRDPCHYEVKA